MRSAFSQLLFRIFDWFGDFFAPRHLRYPPTGPLMPALCVPSEKFPIIDDRRQIKWWCYTNSYGVDMVKVVDLQNGWSVESNQFRGRLPNEEELGYLVRFLRQCPLSTDLSYQASTLNSAGRP